jgi:hypothetical protein
MTNDAPLRRRGSLITDAASILAAVFTLAVVAVFLTDGDGVEVIASVAAVLSVLAIAAAARTPREAATAHVRRHRRGCWLCGASDVKRFSIPLGCYQHYVMVGTAATTSRLTYLPLDDMHVQLCTRCAADQQATSTSDGPFAMAWLWPLANVEAKSRYDMLDAHGLFYPLYGQPKQVSVSEQRTIVPQLEQLGIPCHRSARSHFGATRQSVAYWIAPKMNEVEGWERWGHIGRMPPELVSG